MTELESLVQDRGALAAALDRLTKEIMAKQILKEQHMTAFGFEKTSEGTATVLYTKTLLSEFDKEVEMAYQVVLNLTKPNTITFKREGQERAYGFEIDSVQDFKELLIFANI